MGMGHMCCASCNRRQRLAGTSCRALLNAATVPCLLLQKLPVCMYCRKGVVRVRVLEFAWCAGLLGV
jgi:hypothetical protein